MISSKNKSDFIASDSIRKIFNDLELQYSEYFQYENVSIFKPWRYYVINRLKNGSLKHNPNFIRSKLYNYKNDFLHKRSVHKHAKLNNYKKNSSFQQKEIIFFLFSASHVKACLPLLNYIDKNKSFSYKLFCGTHKPTLHAIGQTKTPYSKLSSFILNTEKVFSVEKYYKKQLRRLNNDIGFKKKCQHDNIDISTQLLNAHRNFIAQKINSLALWIIALENICSVLRPKGIVVFNSDLATPSLAIQIAKRENIKTFYIQHGVYGKNIFNTPIDTDVAILSGEYDKKFVKDLGCLTENIFTVGRSVYDNIYYKKQEGNKLTFQPFNQGTPVITFFTNPLGGVADENENLEIYHDYLKTAEQLSDYNFVVKLHPNDDKETRVNISQTYNSKGNIYNVQNEFDVYDIIANSDICITMFSTVGLEVILFEKPLITMNFRNQKGYAPYADHGAAIPVREKGNLVNVITAILCGKLADSLINGREKAIKNFCADFDGKSAERTMNIILKKINQKGK